MCKKKDRAGCLVNNIILPKFISNRFKCSRKFKISLRADKFVIQKCEPLSKRKFFHGCMVQFSSIRLFSNRIFGIFIPGLFVFIIRKQIINFLVSVALFDLVFFESVIQSGARTHAHNRMVQHLFPCANIDNNNWNRIPSARENHRNAANRLIQLK